MVEPAVERAEIEQAKADPRRFTLLYERYFGDVFRFVLRRAGHRELTADLTQETFLKAMLALPRYQDRGLPFRAWLLRIALNELRMHWRKKKETVIDLSFQQVKGLSEEFELKLDEDDMQRLARALSRLDEARAQLIQLRYMDGMSFLEVGQVLGIGEDAAKMRTHRTLAQLRTYLAPRV
ncbi:MAG: sigma-70 family RNA polymerase sigma factor [Flavobacteriales bacterium]|nr:sigma-70 family RNA polymerase sigma factor [Flavobacteriales bacterium]